MTALAPVLLDPIVLVSDPNVVIARVVQRLTFYTAEPLTWARGLTAERLQSFVSLLGRRSHFWYTTSRVDQWQRITPHGVPAVIDQVCNDALRRPRQAG